jgi:two-component system chemotaxis response regulator CheB
MIDPIEKMPGIVDNDMVAQSRGEKRGQVSTYSCPECGGTLWQVDDEKLIRFRCHVGHSYMGEQLLSEQGQYLEAALWTAIRIFKERATLSRQLAQRARDQGKEAAATRFDDQAEMSSRYGSLIQEHVVNGYDKVRPDDPATPPSTP